MLKTTFGLSGVSLFAGVLLCAACSEPQAAKPPSAPSEAAPAPESKAVVLPNVDTTNAQRFVQGDSKLEVLNFAQVGAQTVQGVVRGYAAPVYAVPVAKGQTLTVEFAPSNTNLYINISDAADQSGAALHRGETDGPTASLKADRDTTYVIAPYQPRAMARRGENGDFSLTVTRG
ncbi:hypothetical protein [Brevundimonas nasdae]|uniref:hypothetical protein n=1 Tax=Brevundimonas nasdae TaxID=172043 RepID=UPI003F68C4DA